MLEIRQALGRGVAYIARHLESDGHFLGSEAVPSDTDPSVIAYIQTVLDELSARGVPGADTVAQGAARWLSRNSNPAQAAGLATFSMADSLADGRELVNRQLPDGSWPAESEGATMSDGGRFVATATRLRALAASMPAIFANAEDDRSFWRDGYVILDFLNPQEVEILSQAHLRIEGTSVAGFYSTWFRSLEVRAETDRATRAVVAPKLKTLFPEYRMVFGTFMSKGCEGETAFPLHQDPSLIDERQWTPLTFWTPLVDVDVINGCMHVAPGSHLLCSGPRPSFSPFPYPELEGRLRQQYMTPVAMRAGQLLIFHSGLIHVSPENLSGSLRVATAGVMIPEAAQLQFCRLNPSSEGTEVFAVEDSFYLRMRAEDSLTDVPKLGEYPAVQGSLDLSGLPVAPGFVEQPTPAAPPAQSLPLTARAGRLGESKMAASESRVALLCIDPLRNELGDFKPFNYSVRKVQAAILANPSLDVEVKVFDYDSKNAEEFAARIEEMDPDIVGASAYVWSFPTFYEVARLLKRSRPDRLIVFGGPSARMEMFNLAPFRDGPQFIDALVLGEGEEVFQEIVALKDWSRARLCTIPGIAASTGDGWFLTPAREVPVLDTLASPFQMGLVSNVKTAHLETFRGCPLSCTFCQWGDLSKANRIFSVEYLVRELGSYVSMGLRSVMIVDAALNLNLRAFRNLCTAEREVGFFKKAFLHAEIYPQYLTEEHMSFLREVGGGLNLGLGLQSYNKSVLGNVERPFDEARFERVVGELLQITPRSEIEIIMGLPGDDPESFRTTLHRALGLGASVRVYHCLVLPNALMSRSPASFDMEYDPINLSMISCLGWKDGAIRRMSEELTVLSRSIPGAFLHNDGYGWHFPSPAESKKGEKGWHFMLSETESGANGGSAPGAAMESPLSIAGPPAYDLPGAVACEEPESDAAAAPAPAVGPARLSVEPALGDALSAGVSRATAAAWELLDIEREQDLLTLKVGTPFGELMLDMRPAIEGTNRFKVVDGVAYSYRGSERDMPGGALKQFESVIEHLRQLIPTVLGAPASAASVQPSTVLQRPTTAASAPAAAVVDDARS